MIWFLVVMGVLFGMLVFALITPLVIRIDTAENDYAIRWKGIASVSIVPDNEEIVFIRYSIFFLKEIIIR